MDTAFDVLDIGSQPDFLESKPEEVWSISLSLAPSENLGIPWR